MQGDWVLKLCKGGHYIPVKVLGVIDNAVDCQTRGGERYSIGENGIEPIPLTPEILKKNGFEDVGQNVFELVEGYCMFWVDFDRHRYGCYHNTSTYEEEKCETRLQLNGVPFVHELQHAMKLCEIEKEIIL